MCWTLVAHLLTSRTSSDYSLDLVVRNMRGTSTSLCFCVGTPVLEQVQSLYTLSQSRRRHYEQQYRVCTKEQSYLTVCLLDFDSLIAERPSQSTVQALTLCPLDQLHKEVEELAYFSDEAGKRATDHTYAPQTTPTRPFQRSRRVPTPALVLREHIVFALLMCRTTSYGVLQSERMYSAAGYIQGACQPAASTGGDADNCAPLAE